MYESYIPRVYGTIKPNEFQNQPSEPIVSKTGWFVMDLNMIVLLKRTKQIPGQMSC